VGTACPDIERTDQGILEFARAAFEGESRIEDLLFVLDFEGVCGEKIFNVSGDLERAPLQEAAENPNDFENCSDVHKSRVLFAQLPIDDLIGLARLFWVVLKQIALRGRWCRDRSSAKTLRRANFDCRVHFL
jgi:hypothetical protein